MDTLKALPQVIAGFMDAANGVDPEAFANCFAEDAVVTDEGQDRKGKAAIRKWSVENHFAYHVKLTPEAVREEDGTVTVTCGLDGDYDKTGLPDPLFLDFTFRLQNGKILSLSIE